GRQNRLAVFYAESQSLREGARIAHGLGKIAEEIIHLLRRKHGVATTGRLRQSAINVLEVPGLLDSPHDLPCLVPLCIGIANRGARDQGYTTEVVTVCQLDSEVVVESDPQKSLLDIALLLGHPRVAGHLDVEAVAEGLLEECRQLQTLGVKIVAQH